jgi:hypothetical protein
MISIISSIASYIPSHPFTPSSISFTTSSKSSTTTSELDMKDGSHLEVISWDNKTLKSKGGQKRFGEKSWVGVGLFGEQ